MKSKITMLCVHGLGDHRNSPWKQEWQSAIMSSFPMQDKIALDIKFMTYDDIFENMEFSLGESYLFLGSFDG